VCSAALLKRDTAQINALTLNDETPLMLAAANGFDDIVEVGPDACIASSQPSAELRAAACA
jgi:hypothetical protein